MHIKSVFSNVTFFGEEALRFIKTRNDHIVGLVETRIRDNRAETKKDEMQRAGWVTSFSPAIKICVSELATS